MKPQQMLRPLIAVVLLTVGVAAQAAVDSNGNKTHPYKRKGINVSRNSQPVPDGRLTTFLFTFGCSTGWNFQKSRPGSQGSYSSNASNLSFVNVPGRADPAAIFETLVANYNGGPQVPFDCDKLDPFDGAIVKVKDTITGFYGYQNEATGENVHELRKMVVDLTFRRVGPPDIAGDYSINGDSYHEDLWNPTYPRNTIVVSGFIGLPGGRNFLTAPDQFDYSSWDERRGRIVDPRTCVPLTCAQTGKACGVIEDGCGSYISCDTCAAPLECNVATNTCCTPLSCADSGIQCGVADDSCGNTFDCGACPSGSACQPDNTCAPAP